MASPDLDDGWFRYAHELDAAISVADFSKGEQVVLREVRARIFGPGLLRSFELSPSDIARRSGLSKGNVGDAIASLVEARVLKALADGKYSFVKNYEAWMRPVKARGKTVDLVPRLGPVHACWCANAPTHAMSFKQTCPPKKGAKRVLDGGTHKETPVPPSSTERSPDGERNVPPSSTERSPSGEHPITPAHIEDPGRELRGRELETEDRETEDRMTSSSAAAAPVPVLAPSRPAAPDPAELARVAAWADALTPAEELGAKVRGFATSYPLDWIEDAILCGLAAASAGKVWRYAHNCLLAWWTKGEKAHKEIVQARARAAARPAGRHVPPAIHRETTDRPPPRHRSSLPPRKETDR